jgi:hypothetical protein
VRQDDRQLQPEQDKNDAVEEKFHHLPHAAGLHAGDQLAPERIHVVDRHACGDRAQNAGNPDMFADQVSGERQQQQQRDVTAGIAGAP